MVLAPRPRSEWPQCGPQADLRVRAYLEGRVQARARGFSGGEAFEPSELEDVICPTNWEIVAQGDRVVCEHCVSPGVCEQLPPAYKPSTKGEVDRSPGVLGWSLLAAAGMWITAVFLKRRRGGRR